MSKICSLFTARYHSGGCSPSVQHYSAQRRWSSCRGTAHWEPAGSGPAAQFFQQNQPSSLVLIIMKREKLPFCGCTVVMRDALIPATLYHIWPPKPISEFHPGSCGLLSSAPCRTSRRRANSLLSIRSQWEDCFTKQSVKEISQSIPKKINT